MHKFNLFEYLLNQSEETGKPDPNSYIWLFLLFLILIDAEIALTLLTAKERIYKFLHIPFVSWRDQMGSFERINDGP